MPSAIWLILYEISASDREAYLAWFHDIHIPEKLARPGYSWAAHYGAELDTGSLSCAALFGGDHTGIFHNPSPAQLGPKQPAETKQMMGRRVNSRALILAGEWSAGPDGTILKESPNIDGTHLSLTPFDCNGQDMDFNAWLQQVHLPAIAADDQMLSAHKLLATTGGARHVLLHERAGPGQPFVVGDHDDWSSHAAEYLQFPLGPAMTAERLWPVKT